jgi:hypothetical protein
LFRNSTDSRRRRQALSLSETMGPDPKGGRGRGHSFGSSGEHSAWNMDDEDEVVVSGGWGNGRTKNGGYGQ